MGANNLNQELYSVMSYEAGNLGDISSEVAAAYGMSDGAMRRRIGGRRSCPNAGEFDVDAAIAEFSNQRDSCVDVIGAKEDDLHGAVPVGCRSRHSAKRRDG